jgi:hypothetical protein
MPAASHAHSSAVANAGHALRVFDAVTQDDNPRRAIFRTVLARARGGVNESRTTSINRALAMSRAIQRVIERVTIADGSVTFTSQSGSVPVTISNRNGFPVKVRIELASPKVDFTGGSSRNVTIEPPGDTVTFSARARSSGTFPITVDLVIPRQGRVDTARVSVRSTAVNVSAVVLTAGGALFLGYWLIRRIRRVGFRITPPATREEPDP